MKIALAQINPIIGDFDGNLNMILDCIKKSRSLGADLCVFPELCIPGYPSNDLLERPGFVDRNLKTLESLAREVRDIAIVVGYVSRSQEKIGKNLQNSAAFIKDGEIISTHEKMLLPTYDVFDERRFFEPAEEVHTVEFHGKKLGITICEDIWNDPDFWPSLLYDRDPVAELRNKGAEILINISASPFTLEKRMLRPEMIQSVARHYGMPLVFVNQVGGNDDLVFDGHSLAFGADGELLARCAEFAEDLEVVDIASGKGEVREIADTNELAVLNALVLGTRDYAGKCGFKSAVLGLSGGIDSSLAAVIGARALGPENIVGVSMHSRYTSAQSVKDVEDLVKNLGIKYHEIPIDEVFKSFLGQLQRVFYGQKPDVTEENIQARIRGTILMALSNKFGHLVLSTGNKSEVATGYCTLYGDMVGGLAVLSDVPKTLVYRLAQEINRAGEIIPDSILHKAPSAELKANQKDEDILPPYPILDEILKRYIESGMDAEEIIAEGFDKATVNEVIGMVINNEYKRRQMAPGLKITVKAFGPGRRVPIAQKWKN
jgi:NAD+ synthase (glutamine-hydrolysing)